ncbi:hypothetical protein AADZ52_12230 [Listeria welshimeri]|nr:hypothetical protein [Listeria welshimeri]
MIQTENKQSIKEISHQDITVYMIAGSNFNHGRGITGSRKVLPR